MPGRNPTDKEDEALINRNGKMEETILQIPIDRRVIEQLINTKSENKTINKRELKWAQH